MPVNEIIQIIVILLHSVIIYFKFLERNENTIKDTFGLFIQIVLIVLFIFELGKNDLSYKAWYWFAFDFLLAFYFLLRMKSYPIINKIKNTKCLIEKMK
jgi:hypothetical protein